LQVSFQKRFGLFILSGIQQNNQVFVFDLLRNRNEGKQKKLNPEKTSVFPGSAFPFGSLRVLEMLRQGFEP
ncbi:MAG: hypothetical protein ACK5YO_28630, partial [Planctomyces sp.]